MAYGCPKSRGTATKLTFWEQVEYHVVIGLFVVLYLMAAPFMALFRHRKRDRKTDMAGTKRVSVLSKATTAAQIAAGYAFMR